MFYSKQSVPAGGSIVVNFPFESIGVRRLVITTKNEDVTLFYGDYEIFSTNSVTTIYELKFESYNGYPNASMFKLVNNSKIVATVVIMIDNVPLSPYNPDYFIRR